MAKERKVKRSRFDGIDLTTLNQEAAKVTGQEVSARDKETLKSRSVNTEETIEVNENKPTKPKKGKGRPKTSSRQPLNTAIEPQNRKRLEFLAMLNGGSVADQLNNILERYFTEIEKVDELINLFEERKKQR